MASGRSPLRDPVCVRGARWCATARAGGGPAPVRRPRVGSVRCEGTRALPLRRQQNPANEGGRIRRAEVLCPSPLPADGLCLIDTPGVGSVSAANSAATREAALADAAASGWAARRSLGEERPWSWRARRRHRRRHRRSLQQGRPAGSGPRPSARRPGASRSACSAAASRSRRATPPERACWSVSPGSPPRHWPHPAARQDLRGRPEPQPGARCGTARPHRRARHGCSWTSTRNSVALTRRVARQMRGTRGID